jgi:hypothetical protein
VSLFGLQYRLRVVSLRESGTFYAPTSGVGAKRLVLLKLPGTVGEFRGRGDFGLRCSERIGKYHNPPLLMCVQMLMRLLDM